MILLVLGIAVGLVIGAVASRFHLGTTLKTEEEKLRSYAQSRLALAEDFKNHLVSLKHEVYAELTAKKTYLAQEAAKVESELSYLRTELTVLLGQKEAELGQKVSEVQTEEAKIETAVKSVV